MKGTRETPIDASHLTLGPDYWIECDPIANVIKDAIGVATLREPGLNRLVYVLIPDHIPTRMQIHLPSPIDEERAVWASLIEYRFHVDIGTNLALYAVKGVNTCPDWIRE